MKHTQSQIESLKEMLRLEEMRQSLQSKVESIVDRLGTLSRSLFTGGETPSAPTKRRGRPAGRPRAAKPVGRPAKAGRKAGGRSSRGQLKDRVFAALESAGNAGVRVKDLAQELGTKPVNIHAWFHAAVKRYPNVQKIAGGHYRLKGSAPAETSAPAPAAKATPRKAAGGRKGAGKRSPRGELSSSIVAELQSAGKAGRSIKELSAKVGHPYKNISIWFATTGKKNGLVKKIGRGQYALKK